jgi:tRNA-dihydrouridine synthase B
MIGKFKPKNRIFLAPMEEVNDIAFRILCKKSGCGLTYTGMINPLTKQNFSLEDKPAVQLFCNNPKGIKEFIKKNDEKVSLWDFNLGCPAKTARKHRFGSFLQNDLISIEKILKTMRNSTKKPVTLKIRKSPYAVKILKIAEKYCDAIAVHPRTQNQGYGGVPDLKFAEKIKSLTKLPVIYSGDAKKENIKELLKIFDYVMIGREAIGRPEIFSKTKISFEDYLKLAEKYNLPFRQIKFQAMNFTKGKENAKELRLKIFKTRKIEEIKKIF